MSGLPERVVTAIMAASTSIALVAGCSHESEQAPPRGSVSMSVGMAKSRSGKIELTCSFANSGKKPLLVGENIDIAYLIRTPDGVESYPVEPSTMVMPGHYVLLPVIPPDRRYKNRFTCGETIERQLTILARDGMKRGADTLEVSAELELLEYDTETKTMEPRREIISCSVALLTMTAMNALSDNRDAKKDPLQGKWDSTVWFDGSFSGHGDCLIQDDKIEDRARPPAGGALFFRYRLKSDATPKEIDLIAPPREGPLYKGYYFDCSLTLTQRKCFGIEPFRASWMRERRSRWNGDLRSDWRNSWTMRSWIPGYRTGCWTAWSDLWNPSRRA